MGDGIGPEALRLDGQVALVTGASKNIGAAIAASFARAGADVLLVARGQELLDATAGRIRALAPERRIETAVADVADRDAASRLVETARSRFGRLDTLVTELAPHVRVNALCPGLVSESGGMRDEEPYERLIRSGAVPMGRIARPEEIAGAAVYLASPAASYTTGEILVANGGRAF